MEPNKAIDASMNKDISSCSNSDLEMQKILKCNIDDYLLTGRINFPKRDVPNDISQPPSMKEIDYIANVPIEDLQSALLIETKEKEEETIILSQKNINDLCGFQTPISPISINRRIRHWLESVESLDNEVPSDLEASPKELTKPDKYTDGAIADNTFQKRTIGSGAANTSGENLVSKKRNRSTTNNEFCDPYIIKPSTFFATDTLRFSQSTRPFANERFWEQTPFDHNTHLSIQEQNALVDSYFTPNYDLPSPTLKRNRLDFDLKGRLIGNEGGTKSNNKNYGSETQTADEISASISKQKNAISFFYPNSDNCEDNDMIGGRNFPPPSQLLENQSYTDFDEWINIDNYQIGIGKPLHSRRSDGNNNSSNNSQDNHQSSISTHNKSIHIDPSQSKEIDESPLVSIFPRKRLAATTIINKTLPSSSSFCNDMSMMDMTNFSQSKFMEVWPLSTCIMPLSFNVKENGDVKEKSSNNFALLNCKRSGNKSNNKENTLETKSLLNEQNQQLTEVNLNKFKSLSGQDPCNNSHSQMRGKFSLSEDNNFIEQETNQKDESAGEININIFRPGNQSKTSTADISLIPASIKKLYDLILEKHSDYSFIYTISAQLCQERVPMNSYVYFKMSLLLSLASFEPKSNRPPVSLMIMCYDTYMANYLVSEIGKLAKRFIGPYHKIKTPVPKSAFKCTWNEANPLMLSQGGVFYAGDWKRLKKSETETLLKYVENATVTSDRSKEETPLDTAIWSLWHPGDSNKKESLDKFFLVFGLPTVMEDDENDLKDDTTDYILNRYRVGIYEASTDFLSIPFEEMREFLEQITKFNVNMTSAAIKLLQQYFVVTRYVRPNVLSKQSFVVLKLFAESFAKLSLRSEVIEMDAVASIFLCENFIHHLYGHTKHSPPHFQTFTHVAMVDPYMNEFYNWLDGYIKENIEESNVADFSKFSEYKD